ncbi:MAG: retroviral-like aspartic protease family protein [Candidatus Rokubacteria bacterium]|nr:retroviral-like aspartic protease family protein [Candidatus Rokubacteria bacterium]
MKPGAQSSADLCDLMIGLVEKPLLRAVLRETGADPVRCIPISTLTVAAAPAAMTCMGPFKVIITLLPSGANEPRRLEALVDTGAAYTVVPRPILQALGCQPHRTQRVRLADGRAEEWSVAQVELECEGRRATTPALVGPAEAPVLLGATTLEELGLGIDSLNRRLVPVELYFAPGS